MIVKVVAAIIAVISFFVILRGPTKKTTDSGSRTDSRQRASQRNDRKAYVVPKAKKAARTIGVDNITLFDKAGRAKEVPAWAMLLHSPLDPPRDPKSWIGGVPKAPEGFAWPRTERGVRMHFLAQIDLAALSDRDNNGLPKEGALLVFFSYQWTNDEPDHVHVCHFLNKEEAANARDVPVPDDLESLQKGLDFFHPGQTFIKRGVDLVPFLDSGAETPAGIPSVFRTPELWISNWGLACAEAATLFTWMENRVQYYQGEKGKQRLVDLLERTAKFPGAEHMQQDYDNATFFASKGPQLLEALTAWRDLAQSKPPLDLVDLDALYAHFARRSKFAESLHGDFAQVLREGAHYHVWLDIHERALNNLEAGTPDADWNIYRSFFEQKATDWRGHRLFGIEPEFPNNWDDLRGQDCFISIREDPLLGNMSEHFYGVSVWCPRKHMSKGSLERGQVVRHCAV
ncbi:MAG: DUF1963 domain-containing protein [Pseudomonadota bacterium]